MRVRLIIFWICTISWSSGLSAQSFSLSFQNLNITDSLPDNRVTAVIQDDNGYIWASTHLGTSRYNGLTFESYTINHRAFEVRDFYKDTKGKLWALTDYGLYTFQPDQNTFIPFYPSDADRHHFTGTIYAMLEDQAGFYWLCNGEGSLLRFHPDSAAVQPYALPLTYMISMYHDGRGKMWVGDHSGNLYELQPSGDQLNAALALQLPHEDGINTILEDEDQRLWISTYRSGLYRRENDGEWTHLQQNINQPPGHSINNNNIQSMIKDQNGHIWMGTDGGGLNLYHHEHDRFYYFQKKGAGDYEIADNAILSLYEGTDGLIWLGTVHGGLNYFSKQLNIKSIPLKTFETAKTGAQSWLMLEDQQGQLWMGIGRDGLRRYDPASGQVTSFKKDPGNPQALHCDIVLSLLEDPAGFIWVGTLYGGLHRFDPATEQFQQVSEISNVLALTTDQKGQIWAGSDDGLFVYSLSGTLLHQLQHDPEDPHSLSDNRIKALCSDVRGDLWIGTPKGLSRLQPHTHTFIHYQYDPANPASLSNDYVLSIFEDSNFNLWVSTFGGGVNCFNRSSQQFIRYGKREGLPAHSVMGTLEDPAGNIWVSHNLGMSKISFHPQRITNFGEGSGIYPSHLGPACLLRNGQIAQGGLHGFSYFDPLQQDRQLVEPTIVFGELKIFDDRTASTLYVHQLPKNKNHIPHLVVNPNPAYLSIHFSALNYLRDVESKFIYQLTGSDNEWHPIGPQRNISFSHLPPGDYQLRIKTNNSLGEWIDPGLQLQLTVLPAFWERTFVKYSAVLFALSFIGFLYRQRMRNIKRQQARLESIIVEKTKELQEQQHLVLKHKQTLFEAEKQNDLLKQKQLRDELEFKKSELSNYTLRSIHKNKLLSRIKSVLSNELKQKEMNKDHLKLLLSLINDSKNLDEEWRNFYQLFDEIHPSFIRGLKDEFPDLTDREIHLCALIKLNFSTSDIATIFSISVGSVKMARHRLRHKLKMIPDQSFKGFFEKLEQLLQP